MRQRNRREAGEGQLGCLVGIVLLLVAIFVAYKLIPVKIKASDLRQTVTDQSKSAGNRNDERITKEIVDKAASLDLPVTAEDVNIKRTANAITVDVQYEVPIVFPGYTFNWKFHHHVENPIF